MHSTGLLMKRITYSLVRRITVLSFSVTSLVKSAEDFDAIVSALNLPNFPYEKSLSNAVCVNRTPRVFSANEAPPEVQIFFHHEMAQTPLYPRWIFFSCEVAAEEGGATPICRSDLLFERLQADRPDFVQACEQRGLRYTNVMPSDNDAKSGMGRSWKSTLGVNGHSAAEKRLRDLDYTWEWLDGDCLRATTPALPAAQLDDGRRVFFNQLIAAFRGWKDARNDPSKSIRHGDGSPLDVEAVKHAVTISEALALTSFGKRRRCHPRQYGIDACKTHLHWHPQSFGFTCLRRNQLL